MLTDREKIRVVALKLAIMMNRLIPATAKSLAEDAGVPEKFILGSCEIEPRVE